jgi:trehalose 6-phosphate synthase/phosphatase
LEFIWFGWPGTTIAPEHQQAVRDHGEKHFRVSPIFLPEESMDRFYHGFCNKTIWPLFHYFPSLTHYQEDYWREYKEVNSLFAERLLQELRPDDVVWVHTIN